MKNTTMIRAWFIEKYKILYAETPHRENSLFFSCRENAYIKFRPGLIAVVVY